jgi:hypothetical protein
VHDAGGEAADRHRIDADQRVLAVQEDHHEMLTVDGAQELPQQRGGVLGGAQLWPGGG